MSNTSTSSNDEKYIKFKKENLMGALKRNNYYIKKNDLDSSVNESIENENKKTYRCYHCNRKVEDVLILSCKHLICLICSSIQLEENYKNFLEKFMNKKCIENNKNKKSHHIDECFDNYKDMIKNKSTYNNINDIKNVMFNNDIILDDMYKKDKVGFITCKLCNIKNKLSLESIEILTKVGLFSHNILNVHKFFFNNRNGYEENNNNNNTLKYNSIEEDGNILDNSLKNYINNDEKKKFLLLKNKYDYINDQLDDLEKYSYICNICSYNEAIIYCKDCVEYLCKECCDNIHEMDILRKKANLKIEKEHEYYEIEKSCFHLKKLVKAPKKFLNITQEDIDIMCNTDDESYTTYRDNNDKYKIYDNNNNNNIPSKNKNYCYKDDPSKKINIYNDNIENDRNIHVDIFDKLHMNDSDFDTYDEEHFYRRQKFFLDKAEKKRKNLLLSKKLNGLVENMKNESCYESDYSSKYGTDGSIKDNKTNELLKLKKKKKKKMVQMRKENKLHNIKKGVTDLRNIKNYDDKHISDDDNVSRRNDAICSNESYNNNNNDGHNNNNNNNNDSHNNNNNNNLVNIKYIKNMNNINSNNLRNDTYIFSNSTTVDMISLDDEPLYSDSELKEIGITNIHTEICQKKNNKTLENINNDIINNKQFTAIENVRCSEHYNYPIQYFCHTCLSLCFCSECAINGIHTNNCNIENINTAFITVLNNYLIQWNEIINELINDLEKNFYESLEDIKNDWSAHLSECYYNLNTKVNYIFNNLVKKEKEIFHEFDTYIEKFKKDNLQYIELLNAKYEDIEKTINLIRQNKFHTNPIDIIKFYTNNIDIIDKTILLNNDFKPIQDLSKVRESKIFYMDFYASQINSYLKYLQAYLNESNILHSK
ncbi:tripartite motif protein, putative [Plasmodium reichenowi]|uniref:Tripartite motif protein, putative n=1 Tax=Plasmodium reichenowi TaxID=5854 RepID=A0A2P9DL26_PLARE|nr:tripartite motif protein, putative [Plasmodium reichenowi]